MQKIYTVAILGVGARGGDTYGKLIQQNVRDKFQIVALCDLKEDRLQRFATEFQVEATACFTDENEFFKEKRADLLIIGTQDKDHVSHILKAFACGYDVMVEKPLTDKKEECEALLSAQQHYGRKALVCHVLRYAPAFVKLKELLDSKIIGRLVSIDALEQVAYWHQAHSYVRGNWRTSKTSSPMILAKCCHDLDLLQYYAASKCESVSSIGGLTYFNAKNAPKNASDRCVTCQYINDCPYSAKKIYIDRWLKAGAPKDIWPYNVITTAPLSEKKLQDAITEGPYGRCVFACDNDVVDHQITQMTFKNGVKATLTMTGFTAKVGRRIIFHGTIGEIELDAANNRLYIKKFGQEEQILNTAEFNDKGYGHGGGDFHLMQNLYDMLERKSTSETSLEASVESHLIGICAEESRIHGGKLIYVH